MPLNGIFCLRIDIYPIWVYNLDTHIGYKGGFYG